MEEEVQVAAGAVVSHLNKSLRKVMNVKPCDVVL